MNLHLHSFLVAALLLSTAAPVSGFEVPYAAPVIRWADPAPKAELLRRCNVIIVWDDPGDKFGVVYVRYGRTWFTCAGPLIFGGITDFIYGDLQQLGVCVLFVTEGLKQFPSSPYPRFLSRQLEDGSLWKPEFFCVGAGTFGGLPSATPFFDPSGVKTRHIDASGAMIPKHRQ
jgi:hypothetical protein